MGTLADGLGCFPLDYETYLPQSDCRTKVNGIRSLSEFSNLVRPLAQTVLYLHDSSSDASPKAISGRTSYLRVRLAFHHYPQLIPQFFNIGGFGPPLAFKQASPWPWIDHSVSGLRLATCALFRLAFAAAPWLNHLTSLQNVTRWPVLQKVRGHSWKLEIRNWKLDACLLFSISALRPSLLKLELFGIQLIL